MADVLFLDAKTDRITDYCYAFRMALVIEPVAEAHVHVIRHLVGPQMVQPEVDSVIKEHHFDYISAAGHGVYSIFKGHQHQEIWKDDVDLSHLDGKVVHLLSCQTGASLGLAMVGHGARAFWGYAEKFVFLQKQEPPDNLVDDLAAGEALKMDCLIDLEILAGSPAASVYNVITEYVADICKNLPAHRRNPILSNYKHLVSPITQWGDPDATV